MGSFWKKVVFKFGGTKIKVWHIASVLILGLLVYYFQGPGFTTIRNTNVNVELGSLKTTRNIANAPLSHISSGTRWELDGTSSRIDPDGASSGLPDLQISIRDFSVSGAKKDKSYNYDDDSMRATVSLHDFSYTIKVECESDRNVLGDTESSYYYYDLDLSMRIRVDEDSWVGFESLSISDVHDDSNQVDFGSVSKDQDFDYSSVGSGGKNPGDYGLESHCTAILRIKKADDNSGPDSYTATAKIKGQIIVVTSQVYSGGGGGDGGNGNDGYTPPPIDEYGLGDLSGIVTLLGYAVIGIVVIFVIIVMYAIFRKR